MKRALTARFASPVRSSRNHAERCCHRRSWPGLLALLLAAGGIGCLNTGNLAAQTPPAAAGGERELHVIGVYEGMAPPRGQTHPEGQAAVMVNRPGKQVTLFLSSYEPVKWSITVAEGSAIERVYLSGYYTQTVEGLAPQAEVIGLFFEDNYGSYLWTGYHLESGAFYQAKAKLVAMTGLEVASFQGCYCAPYPTPFVIDQVQNDPRLRSDYPQPTAPPGLPALSFELAFYNEAAAGSGSVFHRTYTLAGATDGATLLPSGMRVVADAGGRYYYGTRWHRVLKIDSVGGTSQEMALGSGVPELSWPMGMAFDATRGRVLLASLGGEGFLYGYAPDAGRWSLVSSMRDRDVNCIVYHAPEDAIYGVSVIHSEGGRPTLWRLGPDGAYRGEIQLPVLPFGTGPGGYRSELVSVGDYLVLLLGPDFNWGDNATQESRMYLIDPRSGQVNLTYRSSSAVANKLPSVQLVSQADGMMLPAGVAVQLAAEASDPDGAVQTVEFFANNASLGKGRRLTANGTSFVFEWADPQPGAYSLTVKVTDGQGALAVSAPVHVTVQEDAPPPLTEEREFHVVGVYEGATATHGMDHPEGQAAVAVNRPGKRVTLYLSSYEPVKWIITAVGGTVIERVYLSGYYAQKAEGLGSGVEVISSSLSGGVAGYLWTGWDLESGQFFEAAPKVRALVGMEMASFQGRYCAPYPTPFAVDRVQNDVRLRSDYPQPTPLSELPALSFRLTFQNQGSAGGVLHRNYTLAGPLDGSEVLPSGMRLVADAGGRYYYGARWHTVVRVDSANGTSQEMTLGPGVPELSWPMGMAFDAMRGRVLLASLGGEGFLYGYDPGAEQWSVVSSMKDRDVNCLVYHPAEDALYGGAVMFSDGGRSALYRLGPDGAYRGEIQLPVLPFGTGPGGYRVELASAGDYLVLLLGPDGNWGGGTSRESRMYLIDPKSGQVCLTCRRGGTVINRPPTVKLSYPVDGMSLSTESRIWLVAQASDPDGLVQTVEFFANGQTLGYGQRLTPEPAEGPSFYLDWGNVAAGVYSLTARAIDNMGASTVSASVRLSVQEPVRPELVISAPAPGARFTAPADIEVAAEVLHATQTVWQVVFYANDQEIGISEIPRPPHPHSAGLLPHSILWTGVPVGHYALTAKAKLGEALLTSAPVDIEVEPLVEGAFVERFLPAAYVPGVELTVTLTARPGPEVNEYVVEDQPPGGWAVGSISHDGVYCWGIGRVRFGPFLDHAERTLTYQVTPPEWASEWTTGPQEFTGSARADELMQPIGGASVLVQGDRRVGLAALTDGKTPGLLAVQRIAPGVLRIRFRALTARGLSLECADSLASTSWDTLTEIAAKPSPIAVTVSEALPSTGQRFYRLRAVSVAP